MFPYESYAFSWAEENDIEFVPMISHSSKIKFSDGTRCSLVEGDCELSKIVDELNNTKQRVKAEYLMGFNECYSKNPDKPWKWIEPADAAKYWA